MKPARTPDAFPACELIGVQGYFPVTSPVVPRLADDPLPNLASDVSRRAFQGRWRIFSRMTFRCCVSPPQDLSQEGPFDPYCAVADTGEVPLIPVGLPGCQYRMTSYDSAEVADVDPAYRLQLHHPRFL